MLSREQLDLLRRKLLDEQARLKQDLEALTTDELSTDETIGVGNHMGDDATEVFNQEAQLSLRLNQEHALDQVNLALRRMDNGTYGACERCGRAIDFARLEVEPAARYDVDCQRIIETENA